MISVIIPTLDNAQTLADTLERLIPAAVEGLVREVIIADGGSSDATLRIADGAGAHTLSAGPLRSARLIAGAERAKSPWMLFLNPDCLLGQGWEREVGEFAERAARTGNPQQAAVFRFEIEDRGFAPRATEAIASLGDTLFGQARGERGLLISRAVYSESGGHRPLPMLEDIDITRRIGRGRLVRLQSATLSCAARFQAEGYGRHAARQICYTVLFSLNVPLQRLQRGGLASIAGAANRA